MKSYCFPFEKLVVWQEARTLVKTVYHQTSTFPSAEKYGLTSQVNRAAISVASNLAEGAGRTSSKDQGHFSQLAYSSLMELVCQLTLAADLELISDEQLTALRTQIASLAHKINALRKTQLLRLAPR